MGAAGSVAGVRRQPVVLEETIFKKLVVFSVTWRYLLPLSMMKMNLQLKNSNLSSS